MLTADAVILSYSYEQKGSVDFFCTSPSLVPDSNHVFASFVSTDNDDVFLCEINTAHFEINPRIQSNNIIYV
jgi:hypothetical protein